MLGVALYAFALIFVAELPDKTALATLALATRFRTRDVVLGAWLAFAVQTAIAVAAGSLLHLLPARPVRIAAGIGFLLFALLALRHDEDVETEEEQRQAEAAKTRRLQPWLASFLVVFAAEFGDLTQISTANLVAQTREPLAVGIGALLALWATTVIATFTGTQSSRFLRPRLLQRLSAALFAIVGIVVLVQALH
jgi:putative Ca2+/H+ antiporter (TMEM165/GDT1 family)